MPLLWLPPAKQVGFSVFCFDIIYTTVVAFHANNFVVIYTDFESLMTNVSF